MKLSTTQNLDENDLTGTARQFHAIRDAVIERWENKVRSRVDGAKNLLHPVLINTLPGFLDNIAESLSPNNPRSVATSGTNAAIAHGGERARMTEFGPEQVVYEYQILRDCIAIETVNKVAFTTNDWKVVDDSINLAVREALREFTSQQDILRRRIAAALSHDMRTPLAVIMNAASILRVKLDSEQAVNTVGMISSSANRLLHMMTELLDALTIPGGQHSPLEISNFDISDLITEVCQQYAHDSKWVIEADPVNASGYWSRNYLRRALENLVNNALKYGNQSQIKVKARITHGRLMLSVHNMGNPIPPASFSSIFEYGSYTRASQGPDGWGLGLPFVKEVCEAHGGSVLVDSSLASGTTFLIDIPVDCRTLIHRTTEQ